MDMILNRPPVLSVLYIDDEPFLLNAGNIYPERSPDISVSVASSAENAIKLPDHHHLMFHIRLPEVA